MSRPILTRGDYIMLAVLVAIAAAMLLGAFYPVPLAR